MMGFRRWSLVLGFGLVACGGGEAAPIAPGPGNSGSGGQPGNNAGNGPSGGSTATGGNGAAGAIAGATNGGAPTAGTAGAPAGGTGGAPVGGGGAGGGVEPGDTPPVRPLMITAAPGEHRHTIGGRPVGMDNRAPVMMGKLIIELGVDDGGVNEFALKHGFHVYGAEIVHCQIAEAPNTYESKTTAFNGNCRLETFDGVDHDASINVSPADSVSGRLKQALTDLHQQFPEEDWGYFLNADGTVRWSDVGVTGYSHGATSAARWAKKYRLFRAVSRSGPRDNICGQYPAGQCPETVISDWLDEESMTPIERYYGFVGQQDSQYQDILFAMDRMGYVGEPTNIDTTPPPYNGSHRLYIGGGHSNFEDKAYWPAMAVAWGVPQENIDYAAGL